MAVDDDKTSRAWAEAVTSAHNMIADLRVQQLEDRREVPRWMKNAANRREGVLRQENESAAHMETGRRIYAKETHENNAWKSSTQDIRVRYETSEANAYAEALMVQGQRRLIDNMQQSETHTLSVSLRRSSRRTSRYPTRKDDSMR